jgi:hypothetical protein
MGSETEVIESARKGKKRKRKRGRKCRSELESLQCSKGCSNEHQKDVILKEKSGQNDVILNGKLGVKDPVQMRQNDTVSKEKKRRLSRKERTLKNKREWAIQKGREWIDKPVVSKYSDILPRIDPRTEGSPRNLQVIRGPNGEIIFGRSTLYDCDIHPAVTIKAAADGATDAELCAIFGISKSTLRVWEERYEEFAEAMDIARTLSEAWWARQGKANLHTPGFNTSLWKTNMAHRFGWTSSKKEETVKREANVNLNIREEVKIDTSVPRRAAVLAVLQEVGALPAATDPVIDAEVVEIHPTRTDC